MQMEVCQEFCGGRTVGRLQQANGFSRALGKGCLWDGGMKMTVKL